MAEIGALLAKYKPSDKEAQLEHDFIRPVLRILGHTFEVQASLATPDGTKQPDYIFYRDEAARIANKGRLADEANLKHGAFAIGDAKQWDRSLDKHRSVSLPNHCPSLMSRQTDVPRCRLR